MLVITTYSYKHLHVHNRSIYQTWASWCACAAVLSVKSHFKSFSFTPCGAAILFQREELHTRRRVSHVTWRFPGKWQLECVSTVFAVVTRQRLASPHDFTFTVWFAVKTYYGTLNYCYFTHLVWFLLLGWRNTVASSGRYCQVGQQFITHFLSSLIAFMLLIGAK